MKYAPDGSLLWNRVFTLSQWSSEQASSLAILHDGAILVGGGSFLLKYSPEGELLWVTDQGLPLQIKIDSAQNIIGAAGNSLFKLDPQGKMLWRAQANFYLYHIAVDSESNVYAAGSAAFEPTVLAKYSPDGIEQWTAQPVPDDAFSTTGIAVSSSGVFIGMDGSVFHYDHYGVESWRDSSAEGSTHFSVIADASGAIYLTGSRFVPPLNSDFQTLKFQPTIPLSQPTILALPQDLHVVAGTNQAVFSVESGNGPNTFQWRFRGAPISGATNATLELNNIQLTNAGPYSVIVSNSYGYVVTPDARLNVYEPPRIGWRWHQRTNDVVIVGNQLLLPTDFGGSPPITFEWYKNSVPVGQTNSMFVIDELGRADAGAYTVVARSPYGAATNVPLSLTVFDRSPFDDWRWIRPRPQGNWLTAVAFGNGRFVAVGYGGTLLTSNDGLSWAVTNLHRGELTGVAFGNGSFVVVSSLGAIYTSVDGFSWTQRQTSTTHHRFGSVEFLNNRFITSGSTIRSSIDAVTWIDHGSPPDSYGALAFGQGTYLLSGFGYYMISTNLSNWTRFPLGESFGFGSVAAYGNGLFVFGETYDFYTSPDGVEITSHNSADATVLAFLNGSFFAFGSSLERSSDGITWSPISMNAYDDMRSVAYGNGVYVAVGFSGMIVRSTDGNNWTQVSDRGSLWSRGLAYGNGHYVAVAGEDTWSSFDGDNWTSVGPLQGYPNAITWANDTFVVVCAEGDIHHSRDGVQWTHLALTTNYLSDVIHDGKRFVAVGDGTVLLSTNGTQWVTVPLPGTNLNTMAYGEGLYVAGEWISTNAVNWQRIVSPTAPFDITYGNGKFVGVSLNQAIVSDDGRTWRSYEISRQYQNDFVVFAAGTFIAFGSYGRTATSTNGQDWIIHDVWLGGGMAYVNGALWSAGDEETIRRSGQIEPFLRTRKAGAGLELTVQAWPGQSYRLQRAATLGTWTDFQTFTPQTETTTFTDNNPSLQGAFYRVVSP